MGMHAGTSGIRHNCAAVFPGGDDPPVTLGGTTTGEWLSEELVLIGLLIKSFGPFEQHAGVHSQFGQRPIRTIGQLKRHAHSIPRWISTGSE